MKRNAAKPELKYATRDVVLASPTDDQIPNISMTPTFLTQGTAGPNRIGNQIKTFNVRYNLTVNINAVTGDWGTITAIPIRVIIWSPRVATDVAVNHMNSLKYNAFPDPLRINVYRDFYRSLTNPYFTTATTIPPMLSGPDPKTLIVAVGNVRFPRKVQFAGVDSPWGVDPKDQLFMTIRAPIIASLPGNANLNINMFSRTSYIDN